jgi:hypothetical protein
MKTTLLLPQNLPKFYSDRMEDKQQLSFWKIIQIRNGIEIKNPGSKTTFEFGPNLLGVQTRLEKSDKFPKFLICLTFYIVNLDWHGCMVKTEVSIQVPYE